MVAYLDNSATTFMCEKAKEQMRYAIENCWGNPSSLHRMGIDADMLLEESRRTVAKVLKCDSKEIVFTSGGTESNNLAIFGAVYANRRKGNRVITTKIEHPSVLNCFRRLEQEGFEVIYIGTDKAGHVDMEALENAVDEKTILISVMAVNNEVGTIQPIKELPFLVNRKKSPALIHVDAVQAFGKIPLSPSRMGIDLMTVSSHKIHGPKGAGALFIRKGTRINPVTVGGGQEKDYRPGTEPMPAIAGFMGAVSELDVEQSFLKVSMLRKRFVAKLRQIEDVTVNSPDDALPYIINFSLKGLRSETVLNLFSVREIYVSSGSACAKGHKSHVLTAMGLDDKIIDSSLRVSLSRFTTEQELDRLLEAINEAFKVIIRR